MSQTISPASARLFVLAVYKVLIRNARGWTWDLQTMHFATEQSPLNYAFALL